MPVTKDFRQTHNKKAIYLDHNASKCQLELLGIESSAFACAKMYWINFWSIVPTLGFSTYALLNLGNGLSPTPISVATFIVFLSFQAFGLTLGIHRLFSHHAFKPARLLKIVLAVAYTFSLQGSLLRWVSDHRRHHRFEDKPWDIHSPYWFRGKPIKNGVARFCYAHMGWMFCSTPSNPIRYAPDVLADRDLMFISNFYWPIALVGLMLPTGIGYAFGGWTEAKLCFLWAGCFRVVLLQQLTWCIVSVSHMFGSLEPESNCRATNNRFINFFMLGEGYHAEHHRFPTASAYGNGWDDTTGQLIKLLARFGWATALRSPNGK